MQTKAERANNGFTGKVQIPKYHAENLECFAHVFEFTHPDIL